MAVAHRLGFARLAAGTPLGQLGAYHGSGQADRELGDAGSPVLVGAFGLISLTAGLGALAVVLRSARPWSPRATAPAHSWPGHGKHMSA